jgi:hypothetical protein
MYRGSCRPIIKREPICFVSFPRHLWLDWVLHGMVFGLLSLDHET